MGDRIKRSNDELKADRPSLNEVGSIPRLPISILVENVRSVHNVGSIFRTADGFGAEKLEGGDTDSKVSLIECYHLI